MNWRLCVLSWALQYQRRRLPGSWRSKQLNNITICHPSWVVAWLGMKLSSHVSYGCVYYCKSADFYFMVAKLILISIPILRTFYEAASSWTFAYNLHDLYVLLSIGGYCLRCDQNQDGTIDYAEFTKYLTGTHTMHAYLIYGWFSMCRTSLPAHTEAQSTGGEFVSTHSDTYSRSSSRQAEVRTYLSS